MRLVVVISLAVGTLVAAGCGSTHNSAGGVTQPTRTAKLADLVATVRSGMPKASVVRLLGRPQDVGEVALKPGAARSRCWHYTWSKDPRRATVGALICFRRDAVLAVAPVHG